MTIINNPISAQKVVQRIDPDFKLKHEPPIFVTVGRLEQQKGYERLFQVLSRLTFNFHYYVIGDGSLRETLEQQVETLELQDKVTFLGIQKNPFNYLKKASIFLMGSYFEGFPNVLIEAGVCGTPVIAFLVRGGINEIIENGINGFAVPDGDLEAYKAAIEQTLKSEMDRKSIAQLTIDQFDQPKIMAQYEKTFIELVSAKK